MTVIINRSDGNFRFETPINTGSKRVFRLMGEDYIMLKFCAKTPIKFELGDYCDIEGFGRFEYVKPQKPTYNKANGGYDYELQLDAQHIKWRNKIARYLPQYGGKETSWHLTATAETHLSQIIANVVELAKAEPKYKYNGITDYDIAVEPDVEQSAKTIQYDSSNILDALTSIAETFDCEWWVEDNTVHLGKCESDNEYIDFELGNNVSDMSHSDSSENYATRIIPFGSDRNIPQRYRKDLVFTVIDTANGGNSISDTTRVLEGEWFDNTTVKQLAPEDGFSLPFQTAASYTIESGDAGEVLVWSSVKNYNNPLRFGEYRLKLSEFLPRFSFANTVGKVNSVKVVVSFNGAPRQNNSENEQSESESESESNISKISGFVKKYESTNYVYSAYADITARLQDEIVYFGNDLNGMQVTVELYLVMAAHSSTRVSIESMNHGIVSIMHSIPTYRVSGITIDKIGEDGSVTATFDNCIYNDALASNNTDRNWLKLPAGVTMQQGDRYRIVNIVNRKVKSSYFSSRYAAYGNTNIVTNGVVVNRLMLPESYGQSWIDLNEGQSMQQGVEEVVVFDDIYPKAICRVIDVQTKEIPEKVDNDDETSTIQYYTGFIIKDSFFKNKKFLNDYILPGKDLEIVFQDGYRYTEYDIERGTLEDGTPIREGAVKGELHNPDSGKLNGWTFKVKYDIDNGGTLWSIIRDDNAYVPNDIIRPEIGDQFILIGFDCSAIDNLGYVETAEQDLLIAAQRYVAKKNSDASTYDCTMMPDVMKGGLRLKLGTRVNLINDAFIPSEIIESRKWGRKSRIIGYDIPLDIPYNNPIYTVGEKPAYSRIGAIENSVDALKYSMVNQRYADQSASSDNGAYVIRENDSTPVSDSNVFSSRRAMSEFLSKKTRDVAKETIVFENGLEVGDYAPMSSGARFNSQGHGELMSLVVRELLRSDSFVSGMTGEGWRLWLENGLSHLELDKLTVRQVMTVFELIIDKIRSVGGQIIVSAANGKIKDVEETDTDYIITFEGENMFRPHDLMRCQVFNGNDIRGYWVEIAETDSEYVVVPKSEFESTEPRPGDEVVLMGNTENVLRQNLISIAATADGQPRIDVLDGVSNKSFRNRLRTRFGNLDGINDRFFPIDNQPHGNGLYADNAYLKGTFLLTTGEDIKTLFEVTEGKIQSVIEGVADDISSSRRNMLSNPNFNQGFTSWSRSGNLLSANNYFIIANGGFLSRTGASIHIDSEGRRVLRLNNGYIYQSASDMKMLPNMEDGQPKQVRVMFYYKAHRDCTLNVGFRYSNTHALIKSTIMHPSSDYKFFEVSGVWDGIGDFIIQVLGIDNNIGVIDIYMLTLAEEPADQLASKYRSLFVQSDRLVQFAAQSLNADGEILQESGILTEANFAEIYSKQGSDVKATIGTAIENGISTAHITADQITLEGLVTANERFKILQDGSMEAVNANIYGLVRKRPLVINAANLAEYRDHDNPMSSNAIFVFDAEKLGGYIAFDGQLPDGVTYFIYMPSSRALIGQSVCIYNTSNKAIAYSGLILATRDGTTGNSYVLESGRMAVLECVCNPNGSGLETIGWYRKECIINNSY